MAQLILTDEEKAAALWSDLDDAALGALVRSKIALITDTAAQLDRVTTLAAAMLFCCAAAEENATSLEMEVAGLTQAGRAFGDWKVVATRTAPMSGLPRTELIDVRRCRVCGCTDDDCSHCIERTGEACYWVADDLCSACAASLGDPNGKLAQA
ncbi:hypothetical protein E4T66_17380 [Sinimarinibacterium sp. CAU 1509]|uniref:hypothetical protein n=1 Tax=Sinimarinibacterium sp. CAU 1509 TaxID=2562283 RepID=UPI0010AD0D5F|nr:hypothetical protein [Sinimarinibacterium sp. CAU 1509]TJY57183.1 hypothetical protein E4T66_17380 [Sinimarinibacterium sp. CAU 1509]